MEGVYYQLNDGLTIRNFFLQNIDLKPSDQNIDLKIDLKTKQCPVLEELYFEMLHDNFLK